MAGKKKSLRILGQDGTELLILINTVPFLGRQRSGYSVLQRLMQEKKNRLLRLRLSTDHLFPKLPVQPPELLLRQTAERWKAFLRTHKNKMIPADPVIMIGAGHSHAGSVHRQAGFPVAKTDVMVT
ncbi:hypothetical protein D3C75_1042870 [compost metagenome]